MNQIDEIINFFDKSIILSYNIDGDHIINTDEIIDNLAKKIQKESKDIFLISIQEDMSPSIFDEKQNINTLNKKLGLNYTIFIKNHIPLAFSVVPSKSKILNAISKKIQPPRSITTIIIYKTNPNILITQISDKHLNTLGTKSFIISKIKYNNNNIYFINAHLAAGTDSSGYKERIQHLNIIFKEIDAIDKIDKSNSLFILAGDLNFRNIPSKSNKLLKVDELEIYLKSIILPIGSNKYFIKDYILTDSIHPNLSIIPSCKLTNKPLKYGNKKYNLESSDLPGQTKVKYYDTEREPSYCDRILLIIPKTINNIEIEKKINDKFKTRAKTIENINIGSDHLGVQFQKYLKYKNKYINLKKTLQ